MISTQAVVLGHPGETSLKGVSAGECAQEGLRNGNERDARWSFSCFSQRARVDGRTEGPREVSGLGELLSCDTEEPTLERFGNYGEIGKFATACTLVLCGIEIGATERAYGS